MTNYARLGLLSSSMFALLAMACGATSDEPAPVTTPAPTDPPAAEQPAPTPPPPALDHGAPSQTYPAFTPMMGQLKNNGGSVLKNPVVVTVTWAGDDKVAELEAVGDTIGAGQYWKDVAEYGVGAATAARPTTCTSPTRRPPR